MEKRILNIVSRIKIHNVKTIQNQNVVYIGHNEGKKESVKVDEYVSKLDHQSYNVSLFKMMNKQNAPYVIEIEKRK